MRKCLQHCQWLWRQLVDASIMTMPTTKKKKAHLAGIPPSLLDDTTTPCHGLMMLATHFFMVERVKKHKFKYKLSSEIIRVGTIPEPTSELNNLELQKSTHHHQ
jgi:hypothetical protein